MRHNGPATRSGVTRRGALRAGLATAALGGSALAEGALAGCGASPAPSSTLRTRSAPFTGSPPRVVLVRWDGSTPWAQAWLGAASAQAGAANLRVHVVDARGSSSAQREAVDRAAATEPDGVIVDGGSAITLMRGLRALTRHGIPVVVHDVTPASLLPQAPQAVIVRDDDTALAQAVLAAMSAAVEEGSPVGLVGPRPGYADLDRRREVWTRVRQAHQWSQRLLSDSVTRQLQVVSTPDPGADVQNADVLSGALAGQGDVRAVFALNELLAADTVTALRRARVPASLYSVGGTTLGPSALTDAGSPWVATALTDPAQIGAATVRALALRLAGDLTASTPGITSAGSPEKSAQLTLAVPGQLLTQPDLRTRGITTPLQLWNALPTLADAAQTSVATAPWLPAVSR